MVEYPLLILFVVALSTVSIWSIRALKIFGQTCYTALMPGNTDGFLTIFRRARAMADLPSLSEDLRSLPMPWGWKAARRRQVVHARPLTAIPAAGASSTAPWGWPGHAVRGSGYALDILSVITREHGEPVVRPTPAPVAGRPQAARGNPHGTAIRGNRNGEVKLVAARSYDLKDARVPWGW